MPTKVYILVTNNCPHTVTTTEDLAWRMAGILICERLDSGIWDQLDGITELRQECADKMKAGTIDWRVVARAFERLINDLHTFDVIEADVLSSIEEITP